LCEGVSFYGDGLVIDASEGPVISLQPEGIEIPQGIVSLERFRDWVHSDGFPERGRIDWVAGRLEVDMSPGDLNTHGSPKSAIAVGLGNLIQESERGIVFIDSTRISCPHADLSSEPDILVLLVATLEAGRARLVPRSSGGEDRYIEVEGAADLVVECISDASVVKDCQRLRELYHRAGLGEYWLVDARGDAVGMQVLLHGPTDYEPSPPAADGFMYSPVLERSVRLVRQRKTAGLVFFRLEVR
jgi:Uma2 family endonuclease